MHANQKLPKNPRVFYVCNSCHYNTCHLGDWNKHCSTAKHIKLTNANQKSHGCICGLSYTHKESLSRHKKSCMVARMCDYGTETVIHSYPKVIHEHVCECGKRYKYASGLSKHRKKCTLVTENNEVIVYNSEDVSQQSINKGSVTDVIDSLRKDNEKIKRDNAELKSMIGGLAELQTQILEVAKEPKFVTNNNNFNVFLSERCAEALNLGDFIKQIYVSLNDLEYTMQNGKREGIANIIRKGLSELGVYKRPMHCTDIKRQTMYVKDDGEWKRDTNMVKMGELVRAVDGQQFTATREWEKNNPSYKKQGLIQDKWIRLINTITKPVNNIDIVSVSRQFAKDLHVNRKFLLGNNDVQLLENDDTSSDSSMDLNGSDSSEEENTELDIKEAVHK